MSGEGNARGRARHFTSVVVMAIFGVTTLGLEVVWSKLLTLAFGSSTLATTTTLGATFVAMAIGAILAHRVALRARRPARWWAGAQAAGALWSLAGPGWLPQLGAAVALPSEGSAVVALGTVVMLPAGIAGGAALPFAVENWRRTSERREALRGRGLGVLAGAHAIGATAGVVAVTWFGIPTLGLDRSAWWLGGLALAAAGYAWRIPDDPPGGAAVPRVRAAEVVDANLLRVVAVVTGAIGVGAQVVGMRVLDQFSSGTHYTLAAALAVIVLASALGCGAWARWGVAIGVQRPTGALLSLLVGLGLALVVTSLALEAAPASFVNVDTPRAATLAELRASAAVFALPGAMLGAIYAHLGALFEAEGVGRIVALDHLGAAFAAFAFGLAFVPYLGLTDAWWTLVLAAFALALVVAWRQRRSSSLQATPVLLAVGSLALVRGPLEYTALDEGWFELDRRVTPMGVLVVSERPGAAHQASAAPVARRLRLNTAFRMGGSFAFGEGRMGRLPLAMHPNPSRALYLGVGTGATAGAALATDIEHLDAVELVPEILDLLPWFEASNHNLASDPRATLHAADARAFVARARARGDAWDVIVGDLFHPAREGAGRLYSHEHFAAVRDCLNPRGVFVQWIPAYQMDEPTLRTIVRTFTAAFSDGGETPVHAWLASYDAATPALGLVGFAAAGASGLRLDAWDWTRRHGDPDAARLGLADAAETWAGYMLDGEAMAALAGPGPVERDLRPRLAWDLPRRDRGGAPGRDAIELVLQYAVPIDRASFVASPAFERQLADARARVLDFVRSQLGAASHRPQAPSHRLNAAREPTSRDP